MKEIDINTDYIQLDQFLKFTGMASTGGHAKILVNDGEVKVNGEICTQRGKKLRQDDIVMIDDKSFKIKQK